MLPWKAHLILKDLQGLLKEFFEAEQLGSITMQLMMRTFTLHLPLGTLMAPFICIILLLILLSSIHQT